MQQPTDTTAAPYNYLHQQYYPNSTPADHHHPPPFIPTSASAPPVAVSSSDWTHNYPSFPPNPNPNPNQYPFQSYDHPFPNPPFDYSPNPNPLHSSDSYYHSSDDGVYKYNGGGGGGGGRRMDSGGVMFDDYGRPILPGGGNDQHQQQRDGYAHSSSSSKIVRAVPKAEDSHDAKTGGVQKFRVKLLSEGFGQTDMDVLCQIGLDGIRILDPASGRTLKIYTLEMVERWEVLDSYIFAFWAKTSIDPEPRRIRLKSNSYTTNNILDLVTAASIQSKEIDASSNSSDPVKGAEQSAEKKRGFIDWKNLIKPVNEEKDHWVPDEAVNKCSACATDFTAFNRKHHCRNCGDIFCDKCTQGRIALTADEHAQPVRVCDQCLAEVTQRLSNKEASARSAAWQSHEDLARKLQEEMDKKRRTGSKPEASSTRMREVACPTCTVHLQVQVPASGSETIECSVCQHPFLVSAH